MVKVFNIAVITAAVGTALYAAAGYMAVPYVVKTALERGVGHSLNRSVRTQGVSFDPWSGLLEIQGLEVAGKSPDAPALLSVPLLRLDFSNYSIRHFAPVLDEVTVENLKGEINLADPDIRRFFKIDANQEEKLPGSHEENSGGIPDFAIYNIAVKNANVHIVDTARTIDQSITDFNLSLPFVSTLPGAQESLVTPSLSFNLNGSTIYATGSTRPFGTTLEAKLNFRISDLDITSLTKLFPSLNSPQLQFTQGRLSTNMTFVFRNPTGGNPGKLLLNGTAQLKNIATTQTNANRVDPFVSTGSAVLKIRQLDLIERTAEIESVSVENVKVNVPTDSALFTGAAPVPAAGPAQSGQSAAAGPWAWHVDEVTLGNAQVDLVNMGIRKQPGITLSDIQASVTGLTNQSGAPDATLTFSSKILGGSVSAKGSLSGETWNGEATVNADKINLAAISPLIQTTIRGAVTGVLSSDMKVRLSAGKPEISGKAQLNGFNVRQGRENILTTKSIELALTSLKPTEKEASVKEIRITEPSVSVVNYRSGHNVESLLSPVLNQEGTEGARPAQAAEPAAGSGWSWQVESFNILKGSARYADQSQRPVYAVTLSPVDFTLRNLSSAGAASPYKLTAALGQGKLSSEGELSLKDKNLKGKYELENLQLRDISTFLSRKAGFGARSGVLTSIGELSYQGAETAAMTALKGDIALNNLMLFTGRNTTLGGWETGIFKGVDFSSRGEEPSISIARLEIDQPQVKQSKRVQQAAGLASLIARVTGHDKTAERLQKVDNAFNQHLILENVTYEKGRFSAKGLDSQSVAGRVLDYIARAFNR